MNLKTYRRNSILTFSILCGICVLAVIIIVILKLTNTIKSPAFEILLILPIYIFVLLGSVLYFEYRGKLVIDCSKLIIYYKTFSSKKEYGKYNWKGLTIDLKDIDYIYLDKKVTNLYTGVGGSNKYCIMMKDKSCIEVYFYHFGKKKEQEIIEYIKSYNVTFKENFYK